MPDDAVPAQGSSWEMPVISRETGSPSGSVMPRMETGTIFPFGGQITDGLAVAPEQTGGRLESEIRATVPKRVATRMSPSGPWAH